MAIETIDDWEINDRLCRYIMLRWDMNTNAILLHLVRSTLQSADTEYPYVPMYEVRVLRTNGGAPGDGPSEAYVTLSESHIMSAMGPLPRRLGLWWLRRTHF